MKKNIWLIVILLITAVHSQDAADAIEIDGLVINQSISRIGNDFYDEFYAAWIPEDDIRRYNLVISEKPMPNSGSLIQITVDDNVVFERMMRPRSSDMDEIIAGAVGQVAGYLKQYEDIKAQLGGDDMEGDGIH
jgi:curli production assembly/transport component CsgE